MMSKINISSRAWCFALIALLVAPGHVWAASPWDAFQGEKVSYNIKKFGIKAGEASVAFLGIVQDQGKDLVLIKFRATAMNFLDEEKIFADPQTLLPVRVERNLNIFGSKEKITEYYSSNPAQVRVVKTVKGKTTESTLPGRAPLDNLYCAIYRYRKNGKFVIGESFPLLLPTTEVSVGLKRKTTISAGGKNRAAYYLESIPAKYRVWFGVDQGNVPLRIDGAVGMADATMIMRKYEKK